MFTIAPITARDLGEAAKLVKDLRTDMNGRVVCSEADMKVVLEQSLDVPNYTGFIARSPDGDALGYLGLNRRFAIYAGGPFFQITELFVMPEARRHGVARGLIDAAEKHAVTEGGQSIEIGVPRVESHPGTHAFYESVGYCVVGPRMSKNLAASAAA